MDQVAVERRRVEETGTPGVVAIGTGRAKETEVPAGLRDGIAKELDRATLIVQRELAEAEGDAVGDSPAARAWRRLARIHRTIYFMLDAQRLELEALEGRLRTPTQSQPQPAPSPHEAPAGDRGALDSLDGALECVSKAALLVDESFTEAMLTEEEERECRASLCEARQLIKIAIGDVRHMATPGEGAKVRAIGRNH